MCSRLTGAYSRLTGVYSRLNGVYSTVSGENIEVLLVLVILFRFARFGGFVSLFRVLTCTFSRPVLYKFVFPRQPIRVRRVRFGLHLDHFAPRQIARERHREVQCIGYWIINIHSQNRGMTFTM